MKTTDADIPIIDAHHHLWDFESMISNGAETNGHPFLDAIRLSPRYLFDQLQADCRGAGHNVIGSIYVQCGAFYRSQGSAELRPVGEVEFASEVAERAASIDSGRFRACAAIVGHADLTLGAAVADVLDAEIAAGRGRLRGIRHIGSYDADPDVLGPLAHAPCGLYRSKTFREGFAKLGERQLSFDAWILEPQIPDVTELARAFPEQSIVLDHVGTPLGLARFKGMHDDRFQRWKDSIEELATCPNVSVKLGGLGMPFCNLGSLGPKVRPKADALASIFRPYLETCIEAFGANRAMFESNFPVDRWGADFGTIWAAFKLIARGASAAEKTDLFARTAARFYRIEAILP